MLTACFTFTQAAWAQQGTACCRQDFSTIARENATTQSEVGSGKYKKDLLRIKFIAFINILHVQAPVCLHT